MELTDDQLSMFVEKVPCYLPKSLVRQTFRTDWMPQHQPSDWEAAWREFIDLLYSQREITRKARRQLKRERPW